MQLSAMILDIYDDPKGQVLTQKLAGRPLPEKLASAALLNAHELQSLPDRLFALVAQNGDSVVRKYAMHDAAHLATSLIYFCEKGDQLPLDAQKVAAERLAEGCSWYGISVPEKVAGLLGTAMNVAGAGMDALNVKNVAQQGMQKHRQFMAGAAKMAAMEQLPVEDRLPAKTEVRLSAAEERKAIERYAPIEVPPRDAKKTLPFTLDEDTKTQRTGKLPSGIEALVDAYLGEAVKKADLRGTDVMPVSGQTSKPTAKDAVAASFSKRASVDLSAFDGHVTVTKRKHAAYAMPHLEQYPIDTPELVKKAEAYFSEHCGEFNSTQRRIFAQSVWNAASEQGVKIASAAILDYAGDSFGPHFEDQLQTRIAYFEGTGHEVAYEVLLEKKAQLEPAVAATILSEIDRDTGVDRSYGKVGMNLLDPYRAVYGSAKLAADEDNKQVQDTNYTWKDGTEYLTGLQLLNFAAHGPQQITIPFGNELAKKFFADPVTTFKGLTDPQKKLMARLVNSHSVAGAGHA